MSRLDNEIGVVPSILDRLLDDRPDLPSEPVPSRLQNLRQLKRSVSRDLEAMLNTRREIQGDLPEGFAEVARSLVAYGLPDFTSYNLLSPADRIRIRRALEQAIGGFEPRLERVRVAIEPPKEHDRALRFRIEALLRMDPAPEPVTFDASLRLNTQEYVVQGQE